MSVHKREELTVPMEWDILDACNGFSLDIGGSVLKLTYISPEDWVEPALRKQESKGIVRLVNFSREEINEAFDFINKNVHIKRKSAAECIEVYTTGVGGSQFQQDIKEKLNVKNLQIAEFDCFIESFRHIIQYLPRRSVLHQPHEGAFQMVKRQLDKFLETLPNMPFLGNSRNKKVPQFPQDKVTRNIDEPLLKSESVFPCLLVMCGSGFGIILVNEDGTHQIIDGSNRGGRMFLGLGMLLTGAESYEELMTLCEAGQANKVSVTTNSLWDKQDNSSDKSTDNKTDAKEDLYKSWIKDDPEDERVVFCFGHGVGKKLGDFEKRDMARCLLETSILDLVQTVHLCAKPRGIRHVFFTGGFALHPLARRLILTEWLRRDTLFNVIDPSQHGLIQAHFLIHGQSLGSLGALMNHKLQFTGVETHNKTELEKEN